MQYVHCNPFENMPSLSPLIILEDDETPFMEREISTYNSQLHDEESYLKFITPRPFIYPPAPPPPPSSMFLLFRRLCKVCRGISVLRATSLTTM